jgi:hypothetical protein
VPGASSNISTRAVSFQVRLARHLIQRSAGTSIFEASRVLRSLIILSQMGASELPWFSEKVARGERTKSIRKRTAYAAWRSVHVIQSTFCQIRGLARQ